MIYQLGLGAPEKLAVKKREISSLKKNKERERESEISTQPYIIIWSFCTEYIDGVWADGFVRLSF